MNPFLALLHKVVFGSGLGAGAMLVYMLVELARAKPDLAMAVIAQWGAMPIVLIVGMYFANARMGDWLVVMRENTKAQQDLANSVNKIAEKDDREVEERKLMMAYVGQQLSKVLEKLEDLQSQNQQPKAHGACAGGSQ
jgi:uncharacterized coiled-coil protein SlyX